MNNELEQEGRGLAEFQPQATVESVPAPVEDEVRSDAPAAVPEQAQEQVNGQADPATNWHAEAGRKGAHRVHQLIQHGLLYEQEHGLKRGRQRLRQLIQEGKLYEQEHNLGAAKPKRRRRRENRDQVLRTFVQALLRLVQPAYRDQFARLLQTLESEGQ
jgi:hypothetical protein